MKPALLVLFLSILSASQSLANDAPLVAAASSLRQVWPLLMQAYSPATRPRVTFGSSGNLTRQIIQSAPFELLLSANQNYPEMLLSRGIAKAKPVTYTVGALAWVALDNSDLAQSLALLPLPISPTSKQAEAEKSDTEIAFLASKPIQLAIANPAFAPYGQAAKQVLDAHGIGDLENLELTIGENAAQALQFALSGAVDGGIVPLSLVSGAARKKLPPIVVAEIAVSLHQPLTHTMILIEPPSVGAQSLFDFLLSEPAQRIFAQNGFRAKD